MFELFDDMSIHVTRGDGLYFDFYADNGGKNYKFQPGDVLQISVAVKKDMSTVVLQKRFPVEDYTEKVRIYLTKRDTRIGGVISKPTDYWYQIRLNPDDETPQSIVSYDEDGPKLFRLFPEAEEINEPDPAPEEIPIVDQELDMTSTRPVGNQAISRAYQELLAGYERTNAAVAKVNVTPQMYGAIADGVADDTEAVQQAVNRASTENKALVFPQGTYLVSAPIIVPGGVDISGANAEIIKNNTATTKINGVDVNAVFVLSGSKTHIHDIRISGDIENGVDGIAFDELAFMMSVNRVMLVHCRKCFNDIGGLFMAEFDRVHCISSANAFVFDTNRDKTSMTFKSCWAENCGQAYLFKRCNYSTLISCGADWCNSAADSPYGEGFGDQASDKGVYHFIMSRGVTMNGCGVENCWGDGAVHSEASWLTINGLVCTNVKSAYEKTEGAVGMITHNGEASKIIINSVFANNAFENTYVKAKNPNAEQYLIAYNYSHSVYGERDTVAIIASGLHCHNPIIGGSGNFAKDCLIMDEYGKVVNVLEQLNLNGRRFYPVLSLVSGSGSNKLIIPFHSQSNCNYVHYIRVIGINNYKNENIPNAFEFTLEVSSLNTANHATLINKSGSGMSVSTSGMNAIVTLPATYYYLNISVEIMSVKEDLINVGGISLG